ncbi:non-classical arabinogalactan protein 31-like [Panicum miliaceum]|uniref:Non-classical arabinogalactan protein 31-like n=1 Tax=Panicum miliaceum TaxID=4540 RepID=A0A3L6R3A5_PANMI|nr:non-classical arabinogalactan protein 31-like [Panicum miliaceum]
MAPTLGRRSRSVVLGCGLAVVIPAVGCLPSGGFAMGVPRPQPNLNFTIGVEGVVWCKGCRACDASALLRCRHGRRALSVWGATNSRGYFLIQTGAQAAPFTSKDCRV